MRKTVRLVWMICICLCFSACGGKAPDKPEAADDTLSMSAEKLWEAGGVAIDMRDYEKALKYYQLSADKGYVKAWKAIGSLYYYGDGVEQSYEKALEYWLYAAEQGSRTRRPASAICMPEEKAWSSPLKRRWNTIGLRRSRVSRKR